MSRDAADSVASRPVRMRRVDPFGLDLLLDASVGEQVGRTAHEDCPRPRFISTGRSLHVLARIDVQAPQGAGLGEIGRHEVASGRISRMSAPTASSASSG